MEAGSQEPDSQTMVAEYVQNLVDVVGEQMKLHSTEMQTLEKLNKLTIKKQSKVLQKLQTTEEEKGQSETTETPAGRSLSSE